MDNKFILTGSKKQYDFFVSTNNLNPLEFKYLHSIEQLYGTINPIIIKLGTYYLNPIYQKVLKVEDINNV